MKALIFILLAAIGLASCNMGKPHEVLVPEKTDPIKFDTSFMDGPSKYNVEVTGTYSQRTSGPKVLKDKLGNVFIKRYRDLNFDIVVSQNGTLKFSRKGMNIMDFEKDLPKTILDSGILNPIVFKYYPESSMFVFLSRANLPETRTEKGTALILDKDFKPAYIVGGK